MANPPSGDGAIARNTALNIAGLVLPLLVAVISVPFVIKGFGEARFALLTLAWALVGYFGLFDLGLMQAVVRSLAQALSRPQPGRIADIVGSSLALFAGLGLVGGTVAWFVVPALAGRYLNAEPALLQEAVDSGRVLALAVPMVVLSSGLTGVLEAQSRFDLSLRVSVPLGIFAFISPLLVLPFSNSLVPVIWLIALARCAAVAFLLLFALRTTAPLRDGLRVRLGTIKALLAYGGWITISRVINPLLYYLDRFVISAWLPLRTVAYYAAPAEIAMRAYVIPTALSKVLLPAFSTDAGADASRIVSLFVRSWKFTLLAMFPATFAVVLFAKLGLTVWVGAEFAAQATPILQVLMLGVFVNSFNFTTVTLLQGIGRPDLSAKLQLCELPVYAALLWWVTARYGMLGAASVSVLRLFVDLGCHLWLCRREVSGLRGALGLTGFATTLGVIALLAAMVVNGPLVAAVALAAGTLTCLAGGWWWLLDSEERAYVTRFLRR